MEYCVDCSNNSHLEMFVRPGSTSSPDQLFKAGKGRPASGRPGSGNSLSSLGESGGGAGPLSVSSSDSGVDISPSPGSQITQKQLSISIFREPEGRFTKH